MKTIVKLPKSVKRLLATLDRNTRSNYLRLYLAAIAQDAGRSRKATMPNSGEGRGRPSEDRE